MDNNYSFTALDAFLDTLIERGIPAFELVIKQRGKEIYRRRDGAGHKPAGNALYFMYSCTKPVTVVSVMKLVEEGRLSLDAPVSDYLPEYASLTVKEADGTLRPAGTVLTVRHLLTMTSGFSYNMTADVLKDMREKTGGLCTTREAVREMARLPLGFDPGTKFRYGLSHDILAACAEVITGEKFSDYVTRTVLEPLGMNNSFWHLSPEIEGRMEPQYTVNAETKQVVPKLMRNGYVFGPDYDSGGAGLISSIGDMETFTEMLAAKGVGTNGVRILKEETVDLMRSQVLPHEMLDYFIPGAYGNGYTYGLGVRVCDRADNETGSPIGEFSWAGAAGSLQIVSPEKGLACFYVQHVLGTNASYIRKNLLRIIFGIVK